MLDLAKVGCKVAAVKAPNGEDDEDDEGKMAASCQNYSIKVAAAGGCIEAAATEQGHQGGSNWRWHLGQQQQVAASRRQRLATASWRR
eukprot:2382125-Pleurochrysis_carterae.AAC.1